MNGLSKAFWVMLEMQQGWKPSIKFWIGTPIGLDKIFKGCLFVRAVAESNQDDQDIISISKAHKQWIKVLIAQNCNVPNGEALSELIYTVIEGLISRFLVDGFDETLATNMKNSINQLFNIHQH